MDQRATSAGRMPWNDGHKPPRYGSRQIEPAEVAAQPAPGARTDAPPLWTNELTNQDKLIRKGQLIANRPGHSIEDYKSLKKSALPGGYSRVPNALLASSLNASEKLVLLLLTSYWTQSTTYVGGMTGLARALGMSRSQISKDIKHLAEIGIVRKGSLDEEGNFTDRVNGTATMALAINGYALIGYMAQQGNRP